MDTKIKPGTSKWTAAVDRARATDAARHKAMVDAQARREQVRQKLVAAQNQGAEIDAEIAEKIRRATTAEEIEEAQRAAVEPRRSLAEVIAVGAAHIQELDAEVVELSRERSAAGLALARALQNAERAPALALLLQFNGLIDQIQALWPRIITEGQRYQGRTGDPWLQSEVTNGLAGCLRQLISDSLYRPDAHWSIAKFEVPDPDADRD